MAERRQIMKLLERKVPLSQIAKIVGRHQSTIYRELRRNFFRDKYPEFSGWFPWTASELARKRRFKQRKLERNRTLRAYIIDKLQQHWSPEQIAGRLKLHPRLEAQTGRVCSETIYRFVYDRSNRDMALYTLLAKRRRKRRGLRGRKPRGSHIPLYCNINKRPEDIASRETFGHWEADLVIFRREYGKANITSLLEERAAITLSYATRTVTRSVYLVRLNNLYGPFHHKAGRPLLLIAELSLWPGAASMKRLASKATSATPLLPIRKALLKMPTVASGAICHWKRTWPSSRTRNCPKWLGG